MSSEAEKPTTRTRILTAATRLFAHQGFDATGIDEIARTVGITKSVIYYHFKNKDDILSTVIGDFVDEAMTLKRRHSTEVIKQPEATLESTVDMIVDFCLARRDIIRILIMESMKHGAGSTLFSFWDTNVNVAERLVAEATSSGEQAFSASWLMETYFLVAMPVLSFFSYLHDWSEHYHIEEHSAVETFRDSLLTYFQSYVLPRFWLSSKDA